MTTSTSKENTSITARRRRTTLKLWRKSRIGLSVWRTLQYCTLHKSNLSAAERRRKRIRSSSKNKINSLQKDKQSQERYFRKGRRKSRRSSTQAQNPTRKQCQQVLLTFYPIGNRDPTSYGHRPAERQYRAEMVGWHDTSLTAFESPLVEM